MENKAIMSKGGNPNPDQSGLIPWKPGQSGNPAGKPRGTKSLATIIRELENEDFDWEVIPLKSANLKEHTKIYKSLKKLGSPWRAITIKALLESMKGNVKAMEWLRKAGYGDKVDVTTNGKEIVQPLVIPDIAPRNAETQSQTTEDS